MECEEANSGAGKEADVGATLSFGAILTWKEEMKSKENKNK